MKEKKIALVVIIVLALLAIIWVNITGTNLVNLSTSTLEVGSAEYDTISYIGCRVDDELSIKIEIFRDVQKYQVTKSCKAVQVLDLKIPKSEQLSLLELEEIAVSKENLFKAILNLLNKMKFERIAERVVLFEFNTSKGPITGNLAVGSKEDDSKLEFDT